MIARFARHTNNLKPLIDFYVDILGLEVLGNFENHDNYNGVFLGKPDLAWHLEFTESLVEAQHHFDEDDILVFYPTNQKEYETIIEKINSKKIKKINPTNPYWQKNGIMIQDPDGYRVVVCNMKVMG